MPRKRKLEHDPEVNVEALLVEAIRGDIASKLTNERTPPPPQTFGFESCVDLVWKLYWEIERLHHATPHNVIDMKCFAFNAAVTAWALTDWVFLEMTPAQRDRHGAGSLSEFQKLARKQCRALHLCRQIATASKHRTVTLHADRSVSTEISVTPVPGEFGTWEIVIRDGAATHLAVDVLEQARLYWYRFISELGLID